MANRDEDRNRYFGPDEERERWRDPDYGTRDWRAWERDRGWDERDWDRGPRRPHRGRLGRWYGRFGPPEGVGSAAGYTGMRGPGWTAGGFGDPGYGDSGFGTGDYGTSRYGGRGYDTSASREPMPMSRESGRGFEEPDYGRYDRPSRWGSREERTYYYDRNAGPYAGRGPKGYQRSDERIREEVSERLTDDDRLDASGIEVAIESGEVTLTGTVESRRMKRYAEDLVESIRGVRDVHNRLRVGERTRDEIGEEEVSLTPGAERLRKQSERKR